MRTGSSGGSPKALIPGNTIQYFFKGNINEETGNGVNPTLTGSGAHRLATSGEFIAANGSAGNDGSAIIAGDAFTDSIIDTSNLTENDIVLMYGQLYYSAAPASSETIFSIGRASGKFLRLQMLSSGSFQLTCNDGGSPQYTSYGSSIYGFGAYFPFMIAFYGNTGSYDFMVNNSHEKCSGLKTQPINDGVSNDSSNGLCLFANNTTGSASANMGSDDSITSKIRNLVFTRISTGLDIHNPPARINRDQFLMPNTQLRSLYNAHN